MASFTLAPAVRSTTTLVFPAGGVVIPSNANAAVVQFTMPNLAERLDATQRMDFGIELMIAPSTSWKPYIQASWNGGSTATGKNSTVVNPAPSATLGGNFFAAFAGQLARVSVKLRNTMTLGLVVSSTKV